MSYTPEQEATHGDLDRGLGDVDALLVIAHQTSPPHHPAKGSLNGPAPGQNLEALLTLHLADDLDDEVEEGRLVHELAAILGAVDEEMIEPRPALADGVQDHPRAGGVRNGLTLPALPNPSR